MTATDGVDEEQDYCWICSTPEDCSCDGEEYCHECGGSGERIPSHCCVCGGNPYCNCCGKCGAPSVGNCNCPIAVPLVDGRTATV